jgi:hypothetical protein
MFERSRRWRLYVRLRCRNGRSDFLEHKTFFRCPQKIWWRPTELFLRKPILIHPDVHLTLEEIRQKRLYLGKLTSFSQVLFFLQHTTISVEGILGKHRSLIHWCLR